MYSNSQTHRLETCPYNPSHRILFHRMATHLVKCRRTIKAEHVMSVCLYNNTHNVPQPELRFHHEVCPDRINLDKHVIQMGSVDKNKYPIQAVNVDTEENWDYEDCPTYNPTEYVATNPILRSKNVASAAERRNFRICERQRIQMLQDAKSSKQVSGEENSSTTTKIKTEDTVSEDDPYSFEQLQKMINRGARGKQAAPARKGN